MKKLMGLFIFSSLFLITTVSHAVHAIATKNLNFRAGPSTQYTIHGLIPAGQAIFVQNCKGNWCQIYYDSRTGWASAYYLSFKDGNDLYHAYTTLSTEALIITTNKVARDKRSNDHSVQHNHCSP
ncbi:SH3 domain-containing protein [Bartonella bacilliformis]|uniref:SH3b domain-containing protein n=1 Tax=Bartonella bacilliformis Ver097 TaxID=1293911 RepID=A0A072R0K2_BARBA|nr:SH3 domain-containing protein [Bartonella bacilliformis]KEG19255.1 hypothetical protein H710_01035 [Bartonella bacilliformis Ver097]